MQNSDRVSLQISTQVRPPRRIGRPYAYLVWAISLGLSLGLVHWLSGRDLHISMITAVAVLVSAVVAGVAGFAFSALCGAMLLHTSATPVHIVEVMAFASVGIQALMVASFARDIQLRRIAFFLLGGFIGLPFGWYLLEHFDVRLYREIMGGFLLAYGLYMMVRKPVVLAVPGWAERPLNCLIGVLSGVVGGLAAFPGVFVTIWSQMRGWSNTEQRAVYQPFILIMQVITLVHFASRGVAEHATLQAHLEPMVYVPAALCGALAGLLLFKRLSARQFGVAICAAIALSGAALLL